MTGRRPMPFTASPLRPDYFLRRSGAAAASTIGNDLTLSGESITGPGDLTVAGLLAWSGGAMSGRAPLRSRGLSSWERPMPAINPKLSISGR